MPNIMRMFSTANSALKSFQTSLEVTGNNIANANTDGYSRQRVDFSSSMPIREMSGFVGTGVNVAQITRIHDAILEKQNNLAVQENGRWSAENKFLKMTESAFNETNSGEISKLIGDFFNGWYELSNNPSNASSRTSLISSSNVLTNRISQTYRSLKDLRSSITDKVSGVVSDINRLAKQINEFNNDITRNEGSGAKANTIRDKRDIAVAELSKLVDVRVLEQPNGSFNILVAGSNLLVSGAGVAPVSFQLDAGDPNNVQVLIGSEDIASKAVSGELRGLLNVRDKAITDVMSDMDDFAAGLVNSINSLHAVGYGLNGSTGINFFEPFTSSTPGTNKGFAEFLSLSSDVLSDPNNIAAGLGTAPGDNTNALKIADMRNATIAFSSQRSQTFIGYYSDTVSHLGGISKGAKNSLEHSEALKEQFGRLKESISGVSMDEELSNMVMFQRSYESSARFFTTVDKMMETLISRLGV